MVTYMPDTTTGDWYAERLREEQGRHAATEADVSDNLVRPVLERVLGFARTDIHAQPSRGRGRHLLIRPDFICRRSPAGWASVIVEVKKFRVDLARRSGSEGGWKSSPQGQLDGYLRNSRDARNGTWGILTNGIDWLVARREGDDVRMCAPVSVHTLTELQNALADIVQDEAPEQTPSIPEPQPPLRGVDWLDATLECQTPGEFVARVVGMNVEVTTFDCQTIPATTVAYATVAEHTTDRELFQAIHVACLRMNIPDVLIAPQDIVQALAEDPALNHGRVVGVAYTNSGDDRMCRGFVHINRRLHATAFINPHLPGPRAARQFAALSEHGTEESPTDVLKALESEPLQDRGRFHEEIGAWFGTTGKGDNELRHLIRLLFAWLLQERGVLPDYALWDPGLQPTQAYAVHEHVNWLFMQVLAKPKGNARPVPDDEGEAVLIKEVPFLNGSLFSELAPDDLPEPLDNDVYLGPQGLFTILRRYDWTLHDRTGYASEAALDPAMLGDLFEQLILQTEGPRIEFDARGQEHRKMPSGTYYTPPDVADEMTADALAGWLQPELPALEWEDLRALAHPTPVNTSWMSWNASTCRKADRLLERATVLDPCCGSGVFTLAMLHALRRSRQRLGKQIKFSGGGGNRPTRLKTLSSVSCMPWMSTRWRSRSPACDCSSP